MKHRLICMAILATLPVLAHAQVTMSTSVEYKIKNVNSGLVLGISGASQTAGTDVVQWADDGTTDHLWHFMPMGNGEYNIENMLTHQVLGVSNGSTANGAQILQWADNSTSDHLWEVIAAHTGYYIKNVNSGLYLEVYEAGVTDTAKIDQWSLTGCTCQEWNIENTGVSPYNSPRALAGNGTYVHDPMIVLDPTTNVYWLYGTGNTLAYSHDLTTWTSDSPALDPLPSWVANYNSIGQLWAPDVVYHNGYYWQYFAASSFGSEDSAIGLAKSTTPSDTAWTNEGIVISSTQSSGYNAIDPNPVQDASGNWWMAFGSWFDGLHMVALNNTTMLRSTANTTTYHLAERSNGIEGSFVYYYNGYYYLFAAIDGCCNGVNSTYRTVVGRSSKITGPYVDRGGINMLSGGGTIVLSTHSNIIGPGGASILSTNSGPMIAYHYYDGNNNGQPTLGLNLLSWTSDGWPYVN